MGQWVYNVTPEVNERSQWPLILAVCIVLTVAMCTTVGLRAYTRAVILKTVGKDDWVIFFSALCGIIYAGTSIGQTRHGLGLDLKDRPTENLNNYSIINFAGRPFYMAGITGFKVALCLSYLRILSQHTLNYRKIVWVVLVACVLSHFAGTLVLIFQCKPVQKSWLPRTEGTCLRNDITFYVLAANTILFDCIIFFLPIPILMDLQINKRRKAGLLCVFMLGIFTTVCSVLRMVQIITISRTGNSTMLVLWGTIELNVGILLTCIPTLTPLFTYFREKTSRHGYYSNNHSNNHTVPLKSRGPASRLASHNAEPWKESRLDRDSDDNDSQRKIVRDETGTTTMAYPGVPGWDGKGSGGKHVKGSPSQEGIRATTTVTVEVAEESKSLSGGGSVRGRNEKWRGAS